MMSNRYFPLCLLAVAFAICSCNTELLIEDSESTPGGNSESSFPMSFTASFPEVTRTSIDESGRISWKANEVIQVFNGVASATFTSTNTSVATKVSFDGSFEEQPNETLGYWGVYPSVEGNSGSEDGSYVMATLPAVQKAVPGTFDDDVILSVAKTDNRDFKFLNVCSGYVFSVSKEGVNRVIFKGGNGEILAGKVKVSMGADDTPVWSKIEGEGSKTVVVEAPEGETFQTGQFYYVMLLPQTLENGFTITFETSDERGEYKRTGAVTFSRAVVKRAANRDSEVNYAIKDEKEYLHFTAVNDGTTVSFYVNAATHPRYGNGCKLSALQYSLDKETWSSSSTALSEDSSSYDPYAITRYKISVELNAGETVYFRGKAKLGSFSGSYFTSPSGKPSVFTSSDYVYCGGNIMSLLCFDDFADVTSLNVYDSYPGASEGDIPYSFVGLFKNHIFLLTPPALPATRLMGSAYRELFYGCTALTKAPDLPATVAGDYCYYYMFYNCSSLTEAPDLPAQLGLHDYCYQSMFSGCTSLLKAPELPSTSAGTSVYAYMFSGCTSLVEGPPVLPSTSPDLAAYKGMFKNCTSLTSSPVILASTISGTSSGTGGAEEMFMGCSNLVEISAPNLKSASTKNCKNWTSGVASNGTFIRKAGSSWTTGVNGIPSGWTVIDVE